jgi:uncharacterized damage-inducible protein DinB
MSSVRQTLRIAAAVAALTLGIAATARGEEAAAPLGDDERAALVALLEEGRDATEALVARAQGEVFARRPAPERWSVSEVVEHIAATEELLFGLMEQALAAPADPEAEALFTAVPLDGFAARVRDRSQPAQAPEAVQPKGAQTREEGLARFRSTRAATLEFVRTTQAHLRAHTAPVPGGKLSGLHFVTLIANHNLRHNLQITEVLGQLQVP